MLRECLSLQAEGPPALGGRAATLQQLARVMERRGDRDAALAHLADALALHRQAYGEGVPADPESNPIPSQIRQIRRAGQRLEEHCALFSAFSVQLPVFSVQRVLAMARRPLHVAQS